MSLSAVFTYETTNLGVHCRINPYDCKCKGLCYNIMCMHSTVWFLHLYLFTIFDKFHLTYNTRIYVPS